RQAPRLGSPARAQGRAGPVGPPSRSPENGRRAALLRERSARPANGFRAVETSMTMAVPALALLLPQGQPLPPGHPPVTGQTESSALPAGHPPVTPGGHAPADTARGGAAGVAPGHPA